MDVQKIISTAAFPLLTVVFVGLLLRILTRAVNQTKWEQRKKSRVRMSLIGAVIAWGVIVSIASISGFIGNFDRFPLNIGPFLFVPLAVIVVSMFSSKTGDILRHVTQQEIILLQTFRVFVEIILWMLFMQSLLPAQMTFEGRNWDILSGLTAPIVAFGFVRHKALVIVWNLICLGLLINIVTVAILSMPTPLRMFFNEPPNVIVARFPFIFLPAFLVPLAYTLNFLSLRKAMMKA